MKKAEKKFLKKLLKGNFEIYQIEVNEPIEVENDKVWTTTDSFNGILPKQEHFMDKPLLSLNDILITWGKNDHIEHIIKYPVFKRLEKLAKSKL